MGYFSDLYIELHTMNLKELTPTELLQYAQQGFEQVNGLSDSISIRDLELGKLATEELQNRGYGLHERGRRLRLIIGGTANGNSITGLKVQALPATQIVRLDLLGVKDDSIYSFCMRDEIFIQVITAFLAKHGYEVKLCANGSPFSD